MKVWNYMAIMLVLMIFLTFLGITPSGSQDVLSDVGLNVSSVNGTVTNADIGNSEWYKDIFNLADGILIALSAGLVIVGIFTRSFEWKLVVLPWFLLFVVKFVTFGTGIIQYADAGWLKPIVILIFLPLTGMFIFSIIEWFGGSPND